MKKVSILTARQLSSLPEISIHFRPEPELPEEEQYALVFKEYNIDLLLAPWNTVA